MTLGQNLAFGAFLALAGMAFFYCLLMFLAQITH